jgi:beta-lactam-binding protein with PASTA domain
MSAREIHRQGVRNLPRMGTQRGRKLIFLKLLVMVSILLPTFVLPTVRAAEVPNVIGLTQTAAEAAIVAERLTVGAVTQANSATVPIGHVISQDPAAGSKLKSRRAVNLVVSLGAAVPDVVGLTQANAQSAITSAGLTVGGVTMTNSITVPIGTVISQTPAAGTNVAPGSRVDLVVSLGVAVPNVVGSPQAAAQTALTAAGLTVGVVSTANSLTVPLGSVISQNPTAGTNVAAGSAVDLVVSLGVTVPDVVGSPQAAAEAAIVAAGLTVGTVTTAMSETVPTGNVISQTPAGGINVSPGSAVALVISSGPPAFLMGVQHDPATGPLVNSLYRIRTDGVVTKLCDLDHRTHGLAFVGSTLYSVEELTLSTPGTPPNLYTLNPDTGVTRASFPLTLSTGEGLEGGRGLTTDPGTHQLWALLIVSGEVNTFTRLVTINPLTGLATHIAKISGRLVDIAFDAAGTLYAIGNNRPVPGGSPVLPARIYTVNTTTGAATEFLDVSAGAVAGQPNFRESETLGTGVSSDLLYHLSGQHKVTACCTKNILFETIHLTTKTRTSIPITGPEFFVTTALALVPPDSARALGDLDASGTADLVWRNTSDGNTAIWLMNGPVIAASGFPGGVPLVWQIAGVGDVNADGMADVIWRESTSGTVAVWLMNGVTITAVGFPGSASPEFVIAGVGDVNGDGTADLIWRNLTDGTTALWLMNGTTIASTGFPGGVPLEWQMAGVGDVNADGKADVIWRESTSGTVAVWLMNGVTVDSVEFPGGVSLDWKIEGVGDVDGDRKADLIWKNATTGVVVGWLMNGATIDSSGIVGSLTSDRTIELVRDTNGDGKADVVLMNQLTGAIEVWQMNGLTITSVGSPGTVSTDWKIQD